ncbi:MAG: hypothetical protein EPO52_08705 [Herbiconiux sp.]|uniref:RNA polymerase sigma factor n=1 Tax=Herbiconiux sp. TaxID=1871186 RepID=UPI001227D497|nr:hypothetical protein [Herbiconiux sp.]TAJ48226.1 MAG: hypothetical protein EPO52_08705 [Herbiconiux sp.]
MTNTQHTEVSLWEHAREGDARAFGAIFDLHHARIHRQARRLTSSPLDADDVTIPDPGVAPTTPTVAEFQVAVTAAGFGCTPWSPCPRALPA